MELPPIGSTPRDILKESYTSTLNEPTYNEKEPKVYFVNKYYVHDTEVSPQTIKMRNPLPKTQEEQWAFDEIHDSKRGRQIKKWYKEKGKKCPGCDKKFADFSDNDIAFGHIVPQDWARTFPHHLSSIHHPDNLYLTCHSCNTRLSSSFPNRDQTSQTDIENAGTIGDWVRKNIVSAVYNL